MTVSPNRMGKIKMVYLETGTDTIRKLLSIAAAGIIYKHRLSFAIYLFTSSFIALCFLLYSLYHYRDKIEKIAVIVHHIILLLDLGGASLTGYIWKDQFDSLLDGACWTYNYESLMMLKKANQIKEKCGQNLRNVHRYAVYSLIYTLLDLAILAFCERYLVGDDIFLVFPSWFPFELDHYPVYIAVLLWQGAIAIHVVCLVFSTLELTYCLYSHIKTELELLKYALNNIVERANEMARVHMEYQENEINSETLKSYFIKCTRMCAEHHSDIIRYFNSGATVIEILYFIIIGTGLVLSTCTGFTLISDNTALKVKFFGIMAIQLVYLFLMCWIAEKIAEESLTISNTIYVMEWYHLPKECQSTLIVMMIRSNKPLCVKTLTGQIVDLEGAMTVVKASYSYFNMMLAITQ